MPLFSFSTSEEEADYTSDSDSDPFYSGYSGPKIKRPVFVSLAALKRNYAPDMPEEQKIMLFLDAVNDEDIRFMETLLRDGVPVDCIGRDEWTALMKACLNGSRNVARFLLQNGSNPNYHANLFTPLMACCTYNIIGEEYKLPCVELILQYGGDVNAADRHRCTPLMHASSSGYTRIVSRLLEIPETVRNAIDSEGWNAVFHAVSNNRYGTALFLIFHGIESKLHDNRGRTPLIMAQEKNYQKLADALEDFEEVTPKDQEFENYQDYLSNLLKQLPNEEGEGGFTEDTKRLLCCYGYEVDNVSFADFLNMNENELLQKGVKIGVVRRDLLRRVIHAYHLHEWKMTSMPNICRGIPMELGDGVCLIACVAKHLTLIKASVRYLLKRVERRKAAAENTCSKSTIDALTSLFYSNAIIQKQLILILEHQRNVIFRPSDDFIPKCLQSNTRTISKFKLGMIVLSGSYIGYRFRANIAEFVKLFTLIDAKTFLMSMVSKVRNVFWLIWKIKTSKA